MSDICFTKMVGTGNDFIIVDARAGARTPAGRNGAARPWRAMSRALCDRHRGIGADGLLVLEPSASAAAKMRIFNPDGSEAEMCGNGARCAAWYLTQGRAARRNGTAPYGARGRRLTIETRAGVLSAETTRDAVAIQMTEPRGLQLHQTLSTHGAITRYGFVNTGVPHMVVPVAHLDAMDVERLGRALRHEQRFAPGGTNVNFIQAHAAQPGRLRIRTYERGVERETLACGTGMVAAAIIWALSRASGRRLSRRRRLVVEPRSGERVTVAFSAQRSGTSWRVYDVVMAGPAQRVFDGCVSWPIRRAS